MWWNPFNYFRDWISQCKVQRAVERELPRPLIELQRIIGYSFRRRETLVTALLHTSYVNERPEFGLASNQQLEFLGDQVLGLILTHYLFVQYPGLGEGPLTKVRSRLVNNARSLSQQADRIELGSFLLLGRGEEPEGRRKHNILADTYEALVAAIYLDGGLEEARIFVLREFAEQLRAPDLMMKNPDHKSRLQEIIQNQWGTTPRYVVLNESGPNHAKVFEVGVYFNDLLLGQGRGPTKKNAEQQAAGEAIANLELRFRPSP